MAELWDDSEKYLLYKSEPVRERYSTAEAE